MTATRPHTWTFFRAGGLDQVQLENAEDLKHLDELDLKLWVALSCPVKGLEFDPRTLALLDGDGDARVRAPELRDAVRWVCSRLRDPSTLLAGSSSLPLSAIADHDDEGKALLASARQALINLGKADAAEISVEDTRSEAKLFAETAFNGDGVVQPGCTTDPALRQLIEEMVKTHGGEKDRSGVLGVNQAKIDAFSKDANAYVAWQDAGASAMVAGERTAAAHGAWSAVRAKIEDWFLRGELAAYDSRATAHLNRAEADYQTLAPKDLSTAGADLAALPLQLTAPGRALDLVNGINPAWEARLAAFRSATVEPLLGARTVLSKAEWLQLCAALAPYDAWLGTKAGAAVEGLGLARLREILAGDGIPRLNALVAQDLAVAPQIAGMLAVEKLVLFHRDLYLLLRNFVNFSDFYDRTPPPPIFMCGSLYLDQRTCDLCIKVDDANAHSALANLGKIYIAYIACTRPSGEKMTVAVAVTQGDSDYLMVGRNGLFYDRKGRDWDATIIKILDHPISIRQAFWSPYKKIGKMISDTVEKIAGDADKSVMDKASQQVATGATVATSGAKVVEKPRIDTGMLAAIGIAATSLATALSGIAAAVFGLPIWKIPLVMAGAILAISGPSMIIAFLKLRQRTLGPVLEANGWAINGRVAINLPLGNSLTAVKQLPAGAKRLLTDPFEDVEAKKRLRQLIRWAWLAGIIAVFAGAAWIWWEFFRPVPLAATPAVVPVAVQPAVPAAATPAAVPAH